MKSEDNPEKIDPTPLQPFKRYESGLYVPDDHDPNNLIICQHGVTVAGNKHHVASIIAAKPGEYLFEGRRASIKVWITKSTLNFANGIFGESSMKGSILIPTTPFPDLAAKLAEEPWDVDDEEEYPTDAIEAECPDLKRPVFFHVIAPELPCETLQLLKHWDYFEAIEASLSERFIALFGVPFGNVSYKEFEEHCIRLDLKIGTKNPHEAQLESIDACLDVLETWHRDQVRRASTKHA